MVESIFQLRHVITPYISFSAPLYGFLAAVFLLIFFRAMGLLKRESAWRQTMVKGYYLYLPLVLVVCASAWMCAVGAERYVVITLEDTRPELAELSARSMEQSWNTLEEDYGVEDTATSVEFSQSISRELVQIFIREGASLLELHAIQEMTERAANGLQLRLEGHIGKEILSVIAEEKVSVSSLKAQWRGEFDEELRNGLAVDFLLDEIRYSFIRFFKKIQLLFLLLTVPVIMEIGYALYQRPPLVEDS